jgi:hypothetical protein
MYLSKQVKLVLLLSLLRRVHGRSPVNFAPVMKYGTIIKDGHYRALGLVLDFIHRLVCGRQKIPQRFGDWICLRL